MGRQPAYRGSVLTGSSDEGRVKSAGRSCTAMCWGCTGSSGTAPQRYPDLLIEGCSGGGGRFDAGMLYYTPQIWCSDNTDPIDRLTIQYGTSFGYPPERWAPCFRFAECGDRTGTRCRPGGRGRWPGPSDMNWIRKSWNLTRRTGSAADRIPPGIMRSGPDRELLSAVRSCTMIGLWSMDGGFSGSGEEAIRR